MSASTDLTAPRAVFLSYAHEDGVAARCIAEALRAVGIEVWFDQNELVGGDAWDSKIRGQINSCALFVPVISANTQARQEGYFRLEWKLAEDRSHLMAKGKAFIVPVSIDATTERGALVPDAFTAVQWTKLPGGEASAAFVARMQKLLSSSVVGPVADRAPDQRSGLQAARAARSGLPPWIAIALGAVVLALIAYVALRPAGNFAAPRTKRIVETNPTAETKTVSNPTPAAPAVPLAPDKSIAVLPFANLSTERENEFFADGVQDDVITNLAKIRDLTVISRTSTLAYRDAAARNLKKIGAELNVAAILEGSVRRVGSKVHMNAQLIDARTDAHLWADTFDGDASDIFALQADLAKKIAAALKATLTPGERTLIERRLTQNQAAYDLYVRARLLQQETGEIVSRPALERVVAAYGQVLAQDPAFALAHAQAALVHLVLYWFGGLDPSPARAALAKAEVDTAVRLAPDAPETHLALGAYYYRVLRDWNRALAEFRTAETGLPNDAQLCFWLAVTHRRLGRWTEAIGYFERSAALDPHDLAAVFNYAQSLRNLRRWSQTVETTRRCLEFFPTERTLTEEQARAQFMLDGNREAFLRALATLAPLPNDPAGLVDAFRVALGRGDLAAADRALADPRMPEIPGLGQVITAPPVLARAAVAFLRGDRDAARLLADQAIAALRAERWNERQQPWVRMATAQAEAYAGRTEQALGEGEAAIAETRARDATDFANLRLELARIYLAVDQREKALACLREMLGDYCDASPNELRLDPLWSRVKDDPRFEEILQSAKPL